jgi:hypothetical protein
MRTTALFTILLLAACSHATSVTPISLLGDWCAGSENAFHEELSFEVENGVNSFSSWLHQRPAVSGRWDVRGSTLTIQESSGAQTVYTIVSLRRVQVVLRRSDGLDEVYLRDHCLSFDPQLVE